MTMAINYHHDDDLNCIDYDAVEINVAMRDTIVLTLTMIVKIMSMKCERKLSESNFKKKF